MGRQGLGTERAAPNARASPKLQVLAMLSCKFTLSCFPNFAQMVNLQMANWQVRLTVKGTCGAQSAPRPDLKQGGGLAPRAPPNRPIYPSEQLLENVLELFGSERF